LCLSCFRGLTAVLRIMDVQKCYGFLCTILHPRGWCVQNVNVPCKIRRFKEGIGAPILIYEVKTGIFITSLQKRFLAGDSSQMSDHYSYFNRVSLKAYRLYIYSQELVRDRKHLLKCRHKLQNFVNEASIRIPLPDTVVGGRWNVSKCRWKKCQAYRSEWSAASPWQQNSRPQVPGILIALRFWVSLAGKVVKFNWKLNIIVREKTVNPLYSRPRNQGQRTIQMNGERTITSRKADRLHVTVGHTPGKRVWARDDDGDDIREVHVNTSEGFLDGITQLHSPLPWCKQGVSATIRSYPWMGSQH